jgi:hypothetical protein
MAQGSALKRPPARTDSADRRRFARNTASEYCCWEKMLEYAFPCHDRSASGRGHRPGTPRPRVEHTRRVIGAQSGCTWGSRGKVPGPLRSVVITWLTSPNSSDASATITCPIVTSRSRLTHFLKPGTSISTVYLPTGKVGSTYSPRISLVVVRFVFVPCKIAVTLALPMTENRKGRQNVQVKTHRETSFLGVDSKLTWFRPPTTG